jgi:hypothetical protein
VQKKEFNLIILIKHGLYPEFIELAQEAQAKTWLVNEKPTNIKIIHYYGIPGGKLIQLLDKYHEKIRFHSRVSHYLLRFIMQIVSFPFLGYIPSTKIGNELGTVDTEVQCQVIDTLFTLRWKQLAIYKHILDNYEFDYIYDTNGSTYLDLTNLFAQVDSFTESPLYAGNIPSRGFISGANRFFDKKQSGEVKGSVIFPLVCLLYQLHKPMLPPCPLSRAHLARLSTLAH